MHKIYNALNSFLKNMGMLFKIFLAIVLVIFIIKFGWDIDTKNELMAKELVHKHAGSWETGNLELLDSVLHKDVVFAYPGRRLNKQETLNDLIDYNKTFKDTKIYINKIIVNGND